MNAEDLTTAKTQIDCAKDNLSELSDCLAAAYNSVLAHPENIAVAMILTSEFETIAGRMKKLESAILSVLKTLDTAEKIGSAARSSLKKQETEEGT